MLNKVFKCVIVLAQFTPKICLTQYLFCYKKSERKNLKKTVIVIARFQEKLMKTCVCINKASGRLWVVKKVGEKKQPAFTVYQLIFVCHSDQFNA